MRIDICAREDEVTQITLLEVLTSIGAFPEDDSPLEVPLPTGLHRFRVGFEILTVFVDTWLVDLGRARRTGAASPTVNLHRGPRLIGPLPETHNMMAWPTLICGALLVLVGIVGYGTSEVQPPPLTALIPAFFGAALIFCGSLAFNDKLRKHVMHLAAMIGLLGAVGGFMPLIRQISKTGEFDPTKKSAVSGELMILVCVVFVGMCVNSFIQARKARKANPAPMA